MSTPTRRTAKRVTTIREFGPLPSLARESEPEVEEKENNEWVTHALRDLADHLRALGQQTEPCQIRGFEMSYSNVTSCCSNINRGVHGPGWLATWDLDPSVEPIVRMDKHPEFAHYGPFVILDELYVGDRTLFEKGV